jgi:hypothetical protein
VVVKNRDCALALSILRISHGYLGVTRSVSQPRIHFGIALFELRRTYGGQKDKYIIRGMIRYSF